MLITVKWYPISSFDQKKIMGIVPSYSNISSIAVQLYNQYKWFPQRYYIFIPIPHVSLVSSPVNKWKLLSMYVHEWDPKHIGWSLAPCFVRYNLLSSFLMSDFSAWQDCLSPPGYTRIHPMPSTLQSIFKNICLLGSNWAKTGVYITPSFNDSNIVITCDVEDSVGISFQKWSLNNFLSGFNPISKYGAYFKYKLISPIKEWSNLSLYGSFQYLII